MMPELKRMRYLTLVIHRDKALIKRRFTKVKNIVSRRLFSPEGILFVAVASPFFLRKLSGIKEVALRVMSKLKSETVKFNFAGNSAILNLILPLVFQLKSHRLKLDKPAIRK